MTPSEPEQSRPLWSIMALNAVPAIGVVFLGWSMALVLIFYWLENLVTGIMWTRAVRRHHRLTDKRGHYRNQMGVSSNDRKIEFFPDEYRAGALFFTAIHGVFVVLFAFLILDGSELLSNLSWLLVLVVIAVGFTVADVKPLTRDIEQRSFGWLKGQAKRSLYGVHAMHVGLVLGAWTLTLDDRGVLLILFFIVLRTAVDMFKQRPLQATNKSPDDELVGKVDAPA